MLNVYCFSDTHFLTPKTMKNFHYSQTNDSIVSSGYYMPLLWSARYETYQIENQLYATLGLQNKKTFEMRQSIAGGCMIFDSYVPLARNNKFFV